MSRSDPAALVRAIERFKADPEMARFATTSEPIGGCNDTATRFAWYCAELGIAYQFRRWHWFPRSEAWLPFVKHIALEVHGEVFDWTLRQLDSSVTTSWPARNPRSAYRRLGVLVPVCPRCGQGDHAPSECLGLSRSLPEYAEKLTAQLAAELAEDRAR